MSTTIPLAEVEGKLAELVAGLAPGDEIVLTQGEQPVAKLVGVPLAPTWKRRPGYGAGKGKLVILEDDEHTEEQKSVEPRRPGSAVGKLVILADDEEHLEDFREYMPSDELPPAQ